MEKREEFSSIALVLLKIKKKLTHFIHTSVPIRKRKYSRFREKVIHEIHAFFSRNLSA